MSLQYYDVFQTAGGAIAKVMEYCHKFEIGVWHEPEGQMQAIVLPLRLDADELLAFGKALQAFAIEHGAQDDAAASAPDIVKVLAVVVDDHNRSLAVTPEILENGGDRIRLSLAMDRRDQTEWAKLMAALERAYPLESAS